MLFQLECFLHLQNERETFMDLVRDGSHNGKCSNKIYVAIDEEELNFYKINHQFAYIKTHRGFIHKVSQNLVKGLLTLQLGGSKNAT